MSERRDGPGVDVDEREVLRWAVSLLEIHDGVKANPNSQWWLSKLKEMAERCPGCGYPLHKGERCYDRIRREIDRINNKAGS